MHSFWVGTAVGCCRLKYATATRHLALVLAIRLAIAIGILAHSQLHSRFVPSRAMRQCMTRNAAVLRSLHEILLAAVSLSVRPWIAASPGHGYARMAIPVCAPSVAVGSIA